MTTIDYSQKIPNNVDLASDKRLQRALERWQPGFIEWWKEAGPTDFNEKDVYLRTAVSVDEGGWAHYGYVPMPDYRWGIFLTPNEKDRAIGFGDHEGEEAWQQVPGEYRNWLKRLIVTQADTEPASVEQQRLLGTHRAVELRHAQPVPGQRRRGPAPVGDGLPTCIATSVKTVAKRPRSCSIAARAIADHPRILTTFNEPCSDWLSFFCFTMFTDRDGKMQLLSLGREWRSTRSRAAAASC